MSLLKRAHATEPLASDIGISRGINQLYNNLNSIETINAKTLILSDGTNVLKLTPETNITSTSPGSSMIVVNISTNDILDIDTINLVNTSASQLILTMPSLPDNGAVVTIIDSNGFFDINRVKLVGGTFSGGLTEYLLNKKYTYIVFVYNSTTNSWSVSKDRTEITNTKNITTAATLSFGSMNFINTSGGSFTLTLPEITIDLDKGKTIIIIDIGGSLDTNSITLQASGLDEIYSLTNPPSPIYISVQNYSYIELVVTDNNNWIAVAASQTGVGLYVQKTGDSVLGTINMTTNKITNVTRVDHLREKKGILLADDVLTADSYLIQCYDESNGFSIKLPDATTLVDGWSVELCMEGNNPANILDGGNNFLGMLHPTRRVKAELVENTTLNGDWKLIVFNDLNSPNLYIIDTDQNTLMAPFVEYHFRTDINPITATLPITAIDSTFIRVIDEEGTFDINNVTVLPSGPGNTIIGLSSYILDQKYQFIEFFYLLEINTWIVLNSQMIGATSSSDGFHGALPAPKINDRFSVFTGAGLYSNIPLTTAVSITTDPAPALFSHMYFVDTSGGSFNFTLPTAEFGRKIAVADVNGTTAANPLMILATGADVIVDLSNNGVTNVVYNLQLNYGVAELIGIAANKWGILVQNLDATKVSKSGDTMSGNLDMGGNLVTNLAAPTLAQHAVNKTYADNTFVAKAGDTMTGILNMGSNRISNLLDPVSSQDAVSLTYADNNYINTAGDTMAGNLAMSNFKITGLGTATAS
ncbi:MAG: hypothetical protein KDH96_09035, partial [Candidatus Riesia sp.]|nr:hypothetical protein [Candidatus Riesia sp.]